MAKQKGVLIAVVLKFPLKSTKEMSLAKARMSRASKSIQQLTSDAGVDVDESNIADIADLLEQLESVVRRAKASAFNGDE